jgi:hypothetical protein
MNMSKTKTGLSSFIHNKYNIEKEKDEKSLCNAINELDYHKKFVEYHKKIFPNAVLNTKEDSDRVITHKIKKIRGYGIGKPDFCKWDIKDKFRPNMKKSSSD